MTKKIISMEIEEEDLNLIDQTAKNRGLTRSSFIRSTALKEAREQRGETI